MSAGVTTVRVRLEGQPPTAEVQGSGATLANAVRRAIGRHGLGLPLGRTVGQPERIDSHTHRWIWGAGAERYVLLVRQSRSGPSGVGTRAQVLLRLSEDERMALDDLADARGLTRSATVAALVREHAKRPPA